MAKWSEERRERARLQRLRETWRWTPVFVFVTEWLKRYMEKLDGFRGADEVGKLSPEAERFIARRVRQVCADYLKWADGLEAKCQVPGAGRLG